MPDRNRSRIVNMKFDVDQLRTFSTECLRSDLLYHVERKRVFALYVAAMDPSGQVDIPNTTCVQIRTFLQSRSDSLTNDSRLAFEVALHKLLEVLA